MNIIPTFMATLVNTKVSVDRIAQFLDEDEVPAFVSDLKEEPKEDTEIPADRPTVHDYRLGIKNGWFRWNQAVDPLEMEAQPKKGWKFWKKAGTLPTVAKYIDPIIESNGGTATNSGASTPPEAHRFELRDIDIIFPSGKLTIVTGPTGKLHACLLSQLFTVLPASGKTALLMALLGEMSPVETVGTVKSHIFLPKHPHELEEETGLRNYIAFCAQSPWLENLSIKDNILFGSPMDQQRYNQVLECCALKPDLSILEDGDETEIGARGVSLSGGQKAR
jgi:ABC-type multidrug transport system fused ATPase/permease subunit